MDAWIDGLIEGWMNERIYKSMDGYKKVWIREWMDERKNKWINKLMN